MLDRRAFLGATTLSVGGVLVTGLMPMSLWAAAPAACYVDASMHADACGDWQLDDICMAYPPYSLAMGTAPQVAIAPAEPLTDADHHWLA
jgi:hypothetical protein